MSYPLYIVDAFTSRRFSGNPAAVVILDGPKDSAWMQAVAAEMNLSETAFVCPSIDSFHLNWFTPNAEVALCGHATLASAHILWETNVLPSGMPATFTTLSGRLTAVKSGAWINLDFPTLAVEEAKLPNGLAEAIGVKPKFVGKSRFDFLLEVDNEEIIRDLQPDFSIIAKLESVRGVIVTARSSSIEYDFTSRFFAPAVGVNEDPATGSAHCCLGPYWEEKLGRKELVGYQASKRGGIIRMSVKGARIELSGQAVTVTAGQLL
jgi:PhzF family phenazine biosynthesis protein